MNVCCDDTLLAALTSFPFLKSSSLLSEDSLVSGFIHEIPGRYTAVTRQITQGSRLIGRTSTLESWSCGVDQQQLRLRGHQSVALLFVELSSKITFPARNHVLPRSLSQRVHGDITREHVEL